MERRIMEKTTSVSVLTDEEIHFYGEQFQTSEEKTNGISFESYLNQEIQKKVNGQL
jgi:ssRNA-specific RNase YbeY (16S rRNA maturation enzyme)